jgi:WD40 repeat protein
VSRTIAGEQTQFFPRWQGALGDYVTAIVWSPTQSLFAACSAVGEVVLLPTDSAEQICLQAGTDRSIDCLAFSHDGQFLAAAGQDGTVRIWQVQSESSELIATLENAPAWVDQMDWSPTQNYLAFSLGKYVQVWDADSRIILTTSNFDSSSVLNMTWHPTGDRLTVSGYQGVKIWTTADWDDDPYLLTIPSASVAIAWSPDGKYIASGNMDRTITVLKWENPHPWMMRGFPGKIRQLAWSDLPTKMNAPLLASASAESIVIWAKHKDDAIGWEGCVLGNHEATVQAIRFQPGSTLLASASDDGWIALWHRAERLTQTLNGAPLGFTCLAWHPQGHLLAAGGRQGELLLWEQGSGKEFGKC